MSFEYYFYRKYTALYKVFENNSVQYIGLQNGEYCWKDGSDYQINLKLYTKTTLKDWFNMTTYTGKKLVEKELFYDDILNT